MNSGSDEIDPKNAVQTKAQSTLGPYVGEIFRHYKGGLYTVVARSVMEGTLVPLVTYRSNAHGTYWTRTLENFTEVLELPVYTNASPRFIRVKD